MARLTKNKIREIWDSTSRCYTRALKEEFPGVFKDVTEADLDTPYFDLQMREELSRLGICRRSESINARYLARVLNDLTSEELNLVVEADKKGKIPRAAHTIDAILNELLARSIDPESKEPNGTKKSKPTVSLSKRPLRFPKHISYKPWPY